MQQGRKLRTLYRRWWGGVGAVGGTCTLRPDISPAEWPDIRVVC